MEKLKEQHMTMIEDMYNDIFWRYENEINRLVDKINNKNSYIKVLESEINFLKNKKIKRMQLQIEDLEEIVKSNNLNISTLEEKIKTLEKEIKEFENKKIKSGESEKNYKIEKLYDEFRLFKNSKENINLINERLDHVLTLKEHNYEYISKKDLYGILFIAIAFDKINKFIEKYNWARKLIVEDKTLKTLINLVKRERNIKVGVAHQNTVKTYLNENLNKFNFIDEFMLNQIVKVYDSLFISVIDNIEYGLYNIEKCKKNFHKLEDNYVYIKLQDINNNNIIYVYDNWGVVCNECKNLNISTEKIKFVNNKYKIKDLNIGFLYERIIQDYNLGNITYLKLKLKAILKNMNDSELNQSERLTLGYLSLIFIDDEYGLLCDLNNILLLNSESKILYEKLFKKIYTGEISNEHIKANLNSIKLDDRVKNKLLSELINIRRYKPNNINNVDDSFKKPNLNAKSTHEVGNLKEESELRKLGYTTSLSIKQREDILKNKAIPTLGRDSVINHIKWLIKVNGRRKDREYALSVWKYDLNKLLGSL